MSKAVLDSSDCARWWDQYVELADGENISPGQLDEFIQLTDRLVVAAEHLGLDSSPLYRYYIRAVDYDMGQTDTLPVAEEEVYILLERARIRLDQPSPQPAELEPSSLGAGPSTDRLVLNEPGEQPIVLGRPQQPLTFAQYNVVKALVDAGPVGLTKDALIDKSGHTDARAILKRVAKRSPQWAAVIRFPGTPGVRYRIAD